MKYLITEKQLERLGRVHLLLAREIMSNPIASEPKLGSNNKSRLKDFRENIPIHEPILEVIFSAGVGKEYLVMPYALLEKLLSLSMLAVASEERKRILNIKSLQKEKITGIVYPEGLVQTRNQLRNKIIEDIINSH